MTNPKSYDLEYCYSLLELQNGAKPADVEHSWKALSEIYDTDRFPVGTRAHAICEQKIRLVNYAYRNIKAAMRRYDQKESDEPAQDMRELVRLAESGDNNSAFKLAQMLQDGIECREDLHNAAYWYALAAKRGHLESQFKLGEALLNGKGVERDFSKALQCLQITAANNHRESFFLLGLIYENGLGVIQNAEDALKWYRKGAAMGDADASKKVQDLSTT